MGQVSGGVIAGFAGFAGSEVEVSGDVAGPAGLAGSVDVRQRWLHGLGEWWSALGRGK